MVLFLAVAIDAVLPIVPAETLLITAGTYAVIGTVDLAPAVLVAAIGAIAGDTLCHYIGRGTRGTTRYIRRLRVGNNAYQWTCRTLHRRGGTILIAARFLPGGRTATTFTSGYIHYPRLRFLLFCAIGGAFWATYTAGIGYLGGLVFKDQPLLGVAAGIVAALLITGIIEILRRLVSSKIARASSQSYGKTFTHPPSTHEITSTAKEFSCSR